MLHFGVAKSRWIDQITALGPSVAFEMRVPFPLEDDPRAEPAQYLRAAQRRLLDDDSDGAMHKDAVTSAFEYSRDEAKALIAIAAALLTVVDKPV
ncbi:hypothetical protein [Streptomyces bauhiniae]|uniref:hypothetical protein n=1 Tax=Streptomyces bauhiniae TaxID=2340725 RepID=UPI00365580CE